MTPGCLPDLARDRNESAVVNGASREVIALCSLWVAARGQLAEAQSADLAVALLKRSGEEVAMVAKATADISQPRSGWTGVHKCLSSRKGRRIDGRHLRPFRT